MLFALMIVAGLVGFIIDKGLLLVGSRVMKWK